MIPVWIFETEKKSFRYFLRKDFPDFTVIPLSQDRFSPFCEPPNTDADEWRHRLCDVIVRTLEGQVQQKAVLLYATDQLYRRCGVRKGSSTRPTIQDLNRQLNEMMRSKGASHEAKVYISRILAKTIEFDTGVLRKVTHVNKGLSLEELHRHTVLWEMHGLTSELTSCLLTLKMSWVHDYRRNNRHVDHYHGNVLDEASLVVGVRPGFQGESFISENFRRFAEYREFFVMADQLITTLEKPAIANAYTKICLSQASGEEIRALKTILRLTEEQADALTHLEVGQAVVKLAGRYTEPFLITIPEYPVEGYVTDEEVETRMRPIWEVLHRSVEQAVDIWTERIEVTGRTDSGKDRMKEFLKHAAELKFVTQIYGEMRINPRTGTRLKKQAEEAGLIESVEVPSHGRGQNPIYPVLTEKGCKFLGKGFNVLPGRGGPSHRVIQHLVAKKLGGVVEYTKNGKAVDLAVFEKERVIAIEIGESAREIENIRKDLEVGFDEVWVVGLGGGDLSLEGIKDRCLGIGLPPESVMGKVKYLQLKEILA